MPDRHGLTSLHHADPFRAFVSVASTPLRERSLLAREGFGQGLGDEADSFFLRLRRMLLEEPLYDIKRLPSVAAKGMHALLPPRTAVIPMASAIPVTKPMQRAGLVGAGVGAPRPQIVACVEGSEFLRRRRQAGHRDGDRHGDEPRVPVHTAALLVLADCRPAMRELQPARGEVGANLARQAHGRPCSSCWAPWPPFRALSSHARIAASASGSGSGSAACAALKNASSAAADGGSDR